MCHKDLLLAYTATLTHAMPPQRSETLATHVQEPSPSTMFMDQGALSTRCGEASDAYTYEPVQGD